MIRQYQNFDSSLAENIIVARMEARLNAMAKKCANDNRIRNDVAELVNDTFLKAFEQLKLHPDRIFDSNSLWGVLSKILKQKTIDRLRHAYARLRGGPGRKDTNELVAEAVISKQLVSEVSLSHALKKAGDNGNQSLAGILIADGLVKYEDLARACLGSADTHKVLDEQALHNKSNSSSRLRLEQFCVDSEVEADETAVDLLNSVVRFLQGLEQPILVEIVKGKLENKSNEEIGKRLGISRTSVRRKMDLIQKYASKEFKT